MHKNEEDAAASAEASSKKSPNKSAANLRIHGSESRRPDEVAEQRWEEFGFDVVTCDSQGSAQGVLPQGYVAFRAQGQVAVEAMRQSLRAIGVPSSLRFTAAKDEEIAIYALSSAVSLTMIREKVDQQVGIIEPGEPVPYLAESWIIAPDVERLSDIAEIDTLDAYAETLPSHQVLDPLSRFSLRGRGADMEAEARATKPILGKVILAGQATVIYAAPGTGKTLLFLFMLVEAVLTGKIDPGKVFYVNADDSSSGIAEKLILLDELGVHTLVPGFEGFKTGSLNGSLAELIATDQCSDVLVAIDTMKKFVDLMDKKNSSSFGNLMRQFVMKGGTVIALAHTRKNPSTTGQAVYGGTSDIVEDFDAACLLLPVAGSARSDETMVQFHFLKRRGGNLEESYGYVSDASLSYSERLASVRLIGAEEAEEVAAFEERASDQPIIAVLKACLAGGLAQKMELVRAASARSGASRRAVMQVLERYTGDDPTEHHWTYSVQERGAKVFRLHGD